MMWKRYGIKKQDSTTDFHQQDEQQMYSSDKMFDLLYFSEE